MVRFIKTLSFAFLIVFVASCGDSDDSPAPVQSALQLNLDVNVILGIINTNRGVGASCGNDNIAAVSGLVWSEELAKAALDHSNDMQQNGYFDHTSQDGRKFSERATAAGFEGSPVGENIASGYGSEEAVMQGWMKSPGHCSNIMNSNATHVGVARSDECAMWTMVLGKE